MSADALEEAADDDLPSTCGVSNRHRDRFGSHESVRPVVASSRNLIASLPLILMKSPPTRIFPSAITVIIATLLLGLEQMNQPSQSWVQPGMNCASVPHAVEKTANQNLPVRLHGDWSTLRLDLGARISQTSHGIEPRQKVARLSTIS